MAGLPGPLGAVLLAALAAPAEQLPPRTVEAVNTALARARDSLSIPGLTAAVAVGGEMVFARGLGLADLENAVPARAETVYRIASLAKPITATAVLQLAERGRLDLDAPVQQYVPAFLEKPAGPDRGRARWRVTPRLLLAHQGGLRHVAAAEWSSTRHYASLGEALESFKDDPLAYEPGSRCQYSTYGYNLLGSVVEGAAGRAYLDYVREEVFEPAGMTATRLDDVLALIPNRARGYVRSASGEIANAILADTSNKIPGGGLASTAPDMARFGAALLSGRLLKPETFHAMLEPQQTRDRKRTAYGLGFRVGAWKGRPEAWQHGGQPQVSTLLYLRPGQGVAVAILCNLEGVAPALLDLAREIAGLLPAPPPAILTPPGKGR